VVERGKSDKRKTVSLARNMNGAILVAEKHRHTARETGSWPPRVNAHGCHLPRKVESIVYKRRIYIIYDVLAANGTVMRVTVRRVAGIPFGALRHSTLGGQGPLMGSKNKRSIHNHHFPALKMLPVDSTNLYW
jgi:hypothetical protein